VIDDHMLLGLELAMARRDEAAIPGGFDAVLHEDFIEIGSSGRTWSRDETLALLRAGTGRLRDVSLERFAAVELGATVVLVTYDAVVDADPAARRRTRRSSIWLRLAGGWRLRFHQGTPAPPG
jgi:hypothetical protein